MKCGVELEVRSGEMYEYHHVTSQQSTATYNEQKLKQSNYKLLHKSSFFVCCQCVNRLPLLDIFNTTYSRHPPESN